MWADFLQAAQAQAHHGSLREFRHLGAVGLFLLAILDSSPLPTFGGPDILIAILAATHVDPWFEYAVAATVGSVVGACVTYRLARTAGTAYLDGKFGHGRVPQLLKFFDKRGTGALVASTAIPFPFPTSLFFAAAGVSNYGMRKFVAVVTPARAVRYCAIALIADHYGRHFVRVLRHPADYWGWLLVFVAIIAVLVIGGILLKKWLGAPPPLPPSNTTADRRYA